jgi:hypothetical protein
MAKNRVYWFISTTFLAGIAFVSFTYDWTWNSFLGGMVGVMCSDDDRVFAIEQGKFQETPVFIDTPEFACISRYREFLGLSEYAWDEQWRITHYHRSIFLGKQGSILLFKRTLLGRWKSGGRLFSCGHPDFTRLKFDMTPDGRVIAISCWTDSGDDWGPQARLETHVLEQFRTSGFWSSDLVLALDGQTCNNLDISTSLSDDGRVLTINVYLETSLKRLLDQSEESYYQCTPATRVFSRTAEGTWEPITNT